MAYAKIDSHVTDALARLTSAFSDTPNARALVAIFAYQVQRIEDALWSVAQDQLQKGGMLSGAALDALGRVVGQSRKGLDDATYMALLLGQIGTNTSDATLAAVQSVVATIFQSASVFVATPNAPQHNPVRAPGALQIGIGAPKVGAALYGRLLGLVRATRGAGITLANVVIFDASGALAPDGPQSWVKGFSALDGTGGGKLADLILSSN